MRHQISSALFEIMARLIVAKPLSEPSLVYCKFNPWEHISVKFKSEYHHFLWRKCLKISSAKWQPFRRGLHVSRTAHMLGALYWLLIQREFITWQKTTWGSFFMYHKEIFTCCWLRLDDRCCAHTLIHLYIYIYIYRERERERERGGREMERVIMDP